MSKNLANSVAIPQMFCSGELRQICLLIFLHSDQISRHYIAKYHKVACDVAAYFCWKVSIMNTKNLVHGTGLPCKRELEMHKILLLLYKSHP